MLPISERSNELTKNIDIVGCQGILRLLRQSDAQIFCGFEDYPALTDESIVSTLTNIVNSITPLIHKLESADDRPNIKFIMAGAGTSGRLSCFIARQMNATCKKILANISFHYLMAGHDLALIKSQEKAEDDTIAAIEDLKSITDDDPHCTYAIFIGITCGMSAPYVGSQIDWILNSHHPPRISFITSIMGFNSVSMCRNTPIEGFSKTMFEVVSQLESKVGDGKHFILNPVIGPEPIAGSSRMKGGTTTKLLLDLIACAILHKSFPDLLPLDSGVKDSTVASFIDLFERANRYTYFKLSSVAIIIQSAAASLNAGGHIYYLGIDSLGAISIIDASECPPTFGANFSDIRGFVVGGWNTMQNIEGDMSKAGTEYQISTDDYCKNIVPHLSKDDLLIVLHHSTQPQEHISSIISVSKAQCPDLKIAIVHWGDATLESDSPLLLASGCSSPTVHISLPLYSIIPNIFSPVELSAKWILNSISTGAHIIKGKVWSNRMVDLCLSNDKLFRRGVGLVSSILQVDEASARQAVIKSIHNTDIVTPELEALPISQHLEHAVKRKKVVPIAILLASGAARSLKEAEILLEADPVIRNTVVKAVSQALLVVT